MWEGENACVTNFILHSIGNNIHVHIDVVRVHIIMSMVLTAVLSQHGL